MSTSIKKAAAALSLAAGTALAGCAGGSATYSENAGYDGQRTRIENQPMDCTIQTQERGVVHGGTQVYEPGTAVRRCVSSPDSDQRRRGTNPVSDVTEEFMKIPGHAARDASRTLSHEIGEAISEAFSFE